ncbi:MAG TPA: carbohydrate ABC transporter permease, partial [Thermomicrobiales bacterium]|nr:carbohydrate ABC transporter permease [Thermomicrobiales bacterium]
LVLTVITIGPFLWMLSTSFKLPTEAIILPPRWIPDPLTFDNYIGLFTNDILPFVRFIFNSVYISIVVVIGRLLVCALGAYGFARLSFPGRDVAFAMLLGSLMIPDMLAVIPLYSAYARIGWLDTHWPLIIPPIVANTFGTFLLRQFFMTIPKDYEDAAILDGASHLQIFWDIMIPLSKPALATVAVLAFISTWNDFFNPFVFLTSLENFTLPVGLAFYQGELSTEYTSLMAGAVIAIIPTLVVYALAQRFFTQGVVMSGVKG